MSSRALLRSSPLELTPKTFDLDKINTDTGGMRHIKTAEVRRNTSFGLSHGHEQRITVPTNENTNLNNQSSEISLSNSEYIHRSNPNLERIRDQYFTRSLINTNNDTSKRKYGSHDSIDVISSSSKPVKSGSASESFFTMLQNYQTVVFDVIGTDQRSPGPTDFFRRKLLHYQNNANELLSVQSENLNCMQDGDNSKLRNKFYRRWGISAIQGKAQPQIKQNSSDAVNNYSSVNKMIANNTSSPLGTQNVIAPTYNASMCSADIEERQRRRAFAHFDCQSLTVSLSYAAKLRGLLLARRRNTATGASAASMSQSTGSTAVLQDIEEDFGDGQSNDLLESCPFFRNEIGNEQERSVILTRTYSSSKLNQYRTMHRPSTAYGVSILECPPNETLWKQAFCPLEDTTTLIESVDRGALYYRQYFHGQEHQNWFGNDEQLGPIAISIKREKISKKNQKSSLYQYRIIIRTSELLTLRGSVLEDAIPNIRVASKQASVKEVLDYIAPEIQQSCLRLGINSTQCEQQLIKLDEQGLTNKYKVGVLYCRAGQSTEEEMYNNEDAGPAFIEFLETIGKRVRLKGFEHYRAGLDNKSDSTGTHSLYTTYQDCEIMFHVSTMLPFTPNNRQQLLRKRHIGNDIVTIVFQEPGALPFTPKNIRSQFQHVFIIIRAINPCSDNTMYRVSISRSKEVPVFGPPLPAGALFNRDEHFIEFLLAKIINAENAAHRSRKFAIMATRTRQEYLKDLVTNFCTSTIIDHGTKFTIFSTKRKEKTKPRFCGDTIQRGAFCWQIVLQDFSIPGNIDCFLGISTETFVLIEESSQQIVFASPTKSILGWSVNGNSLRIYYHQGESVTITMRDYGERDEQLEVIERLRSVTIGCGAIELTLHRNSMGQLGFHVQPNGIVTHVDNTGQAWVAGLRQGYRVVEICKIAIATLTHDEMVDLLKTSLVVTVTVIKSFSDFTPRRGCFVHNCKFNFKKDCVTPENTKKLKVVSNSNSIQKSVPQLDKRTRNFSPPRSSNSSGYGTGSSFKSFGTTNDNMALKIQDLNAASSECYKDDRRCDMSIYDDQQVQIKNQNRRIDIVRPTSIHDPTKVVLENEKISRNRYSPSTGQFFKELTIDETKTLKTDVYVDNTLPWVKKSADTSSIYSRRPSPISVISNKRDSPINMIAPRVNANTRNQPLTTVQNNSMRPMSSDSSKSDKTYETYNVTSTVFNKPLFMTKSDEEVLLKRKCRSRETINLGQHPVSEFGKATGMRTYSSSTVARNNNNNNNNGCKDAEIIFATARPVTILNESVDDNILQIKEDNYSSSGKTTSSRSDQSPILSLPASLNSKEIEWSMLTNKNTMKLDHEQNSIRHIDDDGQPNSVKTYLSSNSTSSPSIITTTNGDSNDNDVASDIYSVEPYPELHVHLTQLEDKILQETTQRKLLENAVKQLTEENKRLQDESQAAVQQLRCFTEWFFQIIDKQN